MTIVITFAGRTRRCFEIGEASAQRLAERNETRLA